MRSRNFNRPGRNIVVIAHNIRSVQNAGSILRTADCLGVQRVYASGYTPNLDRRTDGSNLPLLPHVHDKLSRELHHAALGAEQTVPFCYSTNVIELIRELRSQDYRIVGLEQDQRSIPLPDYQPNDKIALLLGEEVHGLTSELRELCDDLIEIPMFGAKESYNVSVATGIALYELTMTSVAKHP